MKLDPFILENWLNPAANDPRTEVYLGGSCVLPMTVEELFEVTGQDLDSFIEEFKKMNLGYGFFEGTPRLREAISKLYKTVKPEDVILVHGGTGANFTAVSTIVEPGDNVISIVPNYQQGHKRLDYGESCVLYRLPTKSASYKTQIVHQAELFIKLLGVLMNGKSHPSDSEHIKKCTYELAINQDFHTYLNAYILWVGQRKQPYDKKTKEEVALLPNKTKQIFRDLLTGAVIVNGDIDSSRVDNLKKILPTLDEESESVHSLLHQSLTDDGFATVERQSGVTEHTIRQPEENKPSTLVLDQRKLGELKQQTEIAQSLLSDIFVDDNEEQQHHCKYDD